MSDKQDQDPEISTDAEGRDNSFDDPAVNLVLKLMGGFASEAAQLNSSLYDIANAQATQRGEALDKILNLLHELKQEVPRTSAAGDLVRLMYRTACEGLYPSTKEEFKYESYPNLRDDYED